MGPKVLRITLGCAVGVRLDLVVLVVLGTEERALKQQARCQ
jgi:hypothetical protein